MVNPPLAALQPAVLQTHAFSANTDVVATHADAPKLDVTFLNYPDLQLNELGARGVGEIGLAGVAAAIAAAVHHATGIRVRSVPIEIEALLGAMA